MQNHITDTDLSALFGIDLDAGSDPIVAPDVFCPKCSGTGKFTGYNGRVLGPCFACEGKGTKRHVGVTLAPGACVKCTGTGEWRSGRPCFACNATGREIVGTEVDVSAIATAFEAARANMIKSPKLRLDTFIFSRAPDTGRNAGAIYVKEAGKYLGKVTGGKFIPSMACDGPTKASVIEVASDPHRAAKAYGAKVGSCSCCGRELTKGISIEMGIGPICAAKYGWS